MYKKVYEMVEMICCREKVRWCKLYGSDLV